MKLALICIFLPTLAMAKDLGKEATTFKIEEEAFTVMMKKKLEQVDMEAERKKMEKIAIGGFPRKGANFFPTCLNAFVHKACRG